MQPEPDFTEIGAELVEAAENWERSPGDILGELFPYVYEASRTMSTRAISRWLKERHGVEISQPTISRALRNPEKYWPTFAEIVEPHARTVEDAFDAHLGDFLFDDDFFQWMRNQPLRLNGDTPETLERSEMRVRMALQFLENRWLRLSRETREEMRPYLEDEKEESK